ncbi:unnamed protein product [Phytophthora lilii]|uniref:Unnamed protein product n=1 Tax=Phytophthora lilii TaxID=2077276 RepID=A0A9W6UE79_9STRA|nr:unnamed protein product [Phytophthora lilii]
MGAGVSATHYCGMAAASYVSTFDNNTSTNTTSVLVNGTHAANAASHISLLACYRLTIYSVVRNMQKYEETGGTGNLNTCRSPRPHDILHASVENLPETSNFTSMKVYADDG